MGSRHGCDGNCLLGRPLWRAFSYSSFSLKAAKGGPRILRGTQRVMHLPPCVEKDQWKKTGKLSGPRLRRQLGGQTGQKVAGGVNNNRVDGIHLHLLPLFFFCCCFDFCWPNSTGGHLLADGSFCSERGCGRWPHSHGSSLITWLKISVNTAASRAAGRSPTVHAAQNNIYTPLKLKHANCRTVFFYHNGLILIWISSSHLETSRFLGYQKIVIWGFYILSIWTWLTMKTNSFSDILVRWRCFSSCGSDLSWWFLSAGPNYYQKWMDESKSLHQEVTYSRGELLNKKTEENKRQNLFKNPLIVIGDSSPQSTLCAVWWSGTVASLWSSECDLEMVCSVYTGCPEGCACVGGRTLLAWEARRSDPLSPTPCLTLPLSPAAQGHVMVWERLMHLQRHAVKSN